MRTHLFWCVRIFVKLSFSSLGLSAWRWACAVPRCGNMWPRSGQRKQQTRTPRQSALGSDLLRLVREAGVEPARPCEHWHLKPASLPIPPLAQVVDCLSSESNITTEAPSCQYPFPIFSLGEYRTYHGETGFTPSSGIRCGRQNKSTCSRRCFCSGADDGTRTRTAMGH